MAESAQITVNILPRVQWYAMKVWRDLAEHGVVAPRFSVGVDIDDVLYPWAKTAHQLCVDAGLTDLEAHTQWEMWKDYGCTLEEWVAVLDEPTRDGRLYVSEPFEGVVDALWRLRSHGHYIHLVTARGSWAHGDLTRKHTEEWVERHGIPHDSLTFSHDKTSVPCDYFIDDNVKNAQALTDAGVKTYLLTQPQNIDSALPRVSTLAEFVDIILEAEHAR